MRTLLAFLLLSSVAFATGYKRNGLVIIPKVTSPSITGSTINGRAGVSAVNGITVALETEVASWSTLISGAGGTSDTLGYFIATNLIDQIQAASYGSKIIYLAPMIGTNLQGCVCALRNTLAVASMGSVGGGSASCTQATGLHGDGNVQFTLRIKPSQLGATNNGGLGYWENNIDFTGSSVEPIGCYSSGGNRYVQDLRNVSQNFRWGGAPNAATVASTAVNGHYYGQRSGATLRELFLNGTSIASDTVSDSTAGASDNDIAVIGATNNAATGWKGRCGVCYLTDGTMSGADVTAFDTLLRAYLFVPTGRPQS